MTVKRHIAESIDCLTPEEQAMVMALGIVAERLKRLSRVDFDAVYEMLRHLGPESPEDRDAALRAIVEILDSKPIKRERMTLTHQDEGPRNLDKWKEWVSARVRESRVKADLTQEQLAERSGLPQSHISRIENGVHSPSRSTLEKLADALGVPVSQFDPAVG